jgi:Animal haem peroxidase
MTAVAWSAKANCLSPARDHPAVQGAGPSGYARMFPELPAYEPDETFLHAIGRAGGPCDGEDSTDQAASLGEEAAGWPVFGQFVAHDITADRSALQSHVNPATLRNARAPRLDLECLYGDGPIGHPFLFQRGDPAKFLLGANDADVPRNADGIAIIGDPRNDSHMLMAQIHLAMLKAHNAFVDAAREADVPEQAVFTTAAREMRWHYQWALLDEFLPALVGRMLVDEVVTDGPEWFRPGDGVFIPLEFADAAFRYGHCQIRQEYQLNQNTEPVPIFPDLLGFRPVPYERRVDWTLLFDGSGRHAAQRAKKIDGRLPRSLIHLPVAITGECQIDEYHSLAVRDLLRGRGVGLPSGEAVARHLGLTPLSADEVGLAATGWTGPTPLWYYVLREAAVATAGNRLGPLGGRIVAEVLITLLNHDPGSVRFAGPDWTPRGSFLDLLTNRLRHAAGKSASSFKTRARVPV